jgi:hypothetical protein
MGSEVRLVEVVFGAALERTCVTLLRAGLNIVETTLLVRDTLISFRVHLLLIILLYIMKKF